MNVGDVSGKVNGPPLGASSNFLINTCGLKENRVDIEPGAKVSVPLFLESEIAGDKLIELPGVLVPVENCALHVVELSSEGGLGRVVVEPYKFEGGHEDALAVVGVAGDFSAPEKELV